MVTHTKTLVGDSFDTQAKISGKKKKSQIMAGFIYAMFSSQGKDSS